MKNTVNSDSINIDSSNSNMNSSNLNINTNVSRSISPNSTNKNSTNGVRCLGCNRPYDTNTTHDTNRNKEIIANFNQWKASASFYTTCLTNSIQELLTKVLSSLSSLSL